MRKLMKNKTSGITLIALVVTIIVLLILAGISIQMLTGNNGILQRAVEAKKKTEEEQIIEEAQMDILSTQSSKLADALSEVELEGILSPKYGTLSTEEERTIDKKLTTTDGKYVIPVFKIYNGELKVSLPTIADADEKDYYGQTIDYDVNLDETTDDYDWKIFYNDGTNIYIIAEDYVLMDNCSLVTNSSTGRSDEYATVAPYSLFWPSNNGYIIQNGKDGSADIFGDATHDVATKTLNLANKFLADWKPKVTGTNSASENSNAKMVATLMDTSLWANFATSAKVSGLTSKAGELSAIGGPTLEMWVESWNTIHGSESDDTNKLQLYYASNVTGYFVGTSANPDTTSSYWVDQTETTGYNDSLYYPHKSEVDYCYGYWLASPSASIDVMVVGSYGSVYYSYYYNSDYGVRPVVCLPSDITATWNETDGVWNIIKK